MTPLAPPPASAFTLRHRLLAVGLALVFIVVAGLVTRVAQRIELDSEQVWADVALGQAADFEFGRLTVADVRVGGVLADGDTRTVSAGRYVLVDVRVDADRERVPSLRLQLDSGRDSYLPVVEGFAVVPPGFSTTISFVFELPTEAVDGLSLQVRPTQIISATPQVLRHRVALTREQAQGAAALTVRTTTPEVVAR